MYTGTRLEIKNFYGHPDTMKVHCMENLRVVDASVMPYVTNGNIYAPVMMVA